MHSRKGKGEDRKIPGPEVRNTENLEHQSQSSTNSNRSSAVSVQLWPPKNAYRGPLMMIYKKKLLCYISRPNDLQNKIS